MKDRADLDGLDEYIKLTNGIELTEAEKDQIAAFIARLLGNSQINELISKNPNLMASESQAISDALDIPFHTRWLDEFYSFLNNAVTGYEKLISGKKLDEHEKLSLRQFAILHEIAALAPIFQRLDYLDIITRNKNVEQFHNKIMKCNEIIKYLTLRIKVESQSKLGFFLTGKRADAFNVDLKYFSAAVKLYVKNDLSGMRPEREPPISKPK